jgi:hypothetical protein
MKILDREYDLRPITWKDRRALHAKHAQVYLGSEFGEGNITKMNIDWDRFYEVIELALNIAFNDPEKELDGLTDSEIDTVGQSLLNEYLNPAKKKNGSSG